jgi:hypothetical protein
MGLIKRLVGWDTQKKRKRKRTKLVKTEVLKVVDFFCIFFFFLETIHEGFEGLD